MDINRLPPGKNPPHEVNVLVEVPLRSDPIKYEYDPDKARALLEEAGCLPCTIRVAISTSGSGQMQPLPMNELVKEQLEAVGFEVELVPMDWGTFLGRAFKRDAPEAGGWNLYHSLDFGFNVGTPSTDVSLAASCERARPGWPCDEAMERLRAAWVAQTDAQKRRDLVRQIQERFYEIVPFVPWGQFVRPIAVRSNIVDIGTTLVPVFWNLDKT